MTVSVSVEKLDAITRLRADIQYLFEDRLRVKMLVTDFLDDHPGENALGVLLASGTGVESGPAEPAAPESRLPRQGRPPEQGERPAELVGRHRDFQQFLNKEGPFYDEEFMLDLEFNFDSGTCTIHHINLPVRLRGKGLGSSVVGKAEALAGEMSMKEIYVPSEHRSTAFWLKMGYLFSFPGEKAFYEKNSVKTNLYVAYDLRKRLRD